jgi:hypothetical protein
MQEYVTGVQICLAPASQKLFLSYTALRSAPAFLIRLQVPRSRTTDKALAGIRSITIQGLQCS